MRHFLPTIVLAGLVTALWMYWKQVDPIDLNASAQAGNADREKHMLIEDAFSRINPLFREAVILRDIEDLSYDEIAEVLQISLGTVKSRIMRGREALRQELTGRLQPEPSLRLAHE